MLGGSLAGAIALALPRSSHASGPWSGYDAAMVIDGCASPGNSAYDGEEPLPDDAVADLRSSGVTCPLARRMRPRRRARTSSIRNGLAT